MGAEPELQPYNVSLQLRMVERLEAKLCNQLVNLWFHMHKAGN